MIVLSLFDGMSCGRIALTELGVKVDKYFASEVDKFAINQTQLNFPNTIQLGSVTELEYVDGVLYRGDNVIYKGNIDLLIGGSPCQNLSFAGNQKGLSTKEGVNITSLDMYLNLKKEGFEFEGESYLFWEFVKLKEQINPKYFLLENVKMSKKWKGVFSRILGIIPVQINSSLVSAQNRVRLYWSNIKVKEVGLFGEKHTDIPQPRDRGIYLKDILEKEVDDKYYLSDKMIKWLMSRPKPFNTFKPVPLTYNGKGGCLTARMFKMGAQDNYITTHSTQPRQGKGKGGKGHLWKIDGKNYCLDTGCTTAIEVVDGINQIGNIKSSSSFDNPQSGRVYGTNGKSPTILANNPKDKSKILEGRKIRRLTPTECARLQTVPDWYKWECSNTQQYKMLGNGWTVEVIKHIFRFL